MSNMSELSIEIREQHLRELAEVSPRVAFTVRLPREEYDALQALYYANVQEHRLSFNRWMRNMIAAGAWAIERKEITP